MPLKERRLLVIGHVWPEPKATAAGVRMMQLLSSFQELGYRITFGCAAQKTAYSTDLGQMEIEEVAIELNAPSFDDFVIQLKPDLVIFDRFMTEEQYGWRIAEHSSHSLRILNTEDLHSLRSVRSSAQKQEEDFSVDKWLQSDIAKRELASIFRSDLSLIISGFEMDFLKANTQVSETLLHYLPFLYEAERNNGNKDSKGFDQRKDFVFFGNGKHKPNIDAIEWLYNEIWPVLREEVPGSQLHIYGAYLPGNVLAMSDSKHGFLVHGWADDSTEVLVKSRVNLAPLRFGAGLKGKLFEAMRNGTPSAMTSIAMEGLSYIAEDAVVAGDDVESFVQVAKNLYLKESTWLWQREADQRLLLRDFVRTSHMSSLALKLEELSENREKHRMQNQMGTLLMHHTMLSTKYLSKWIEAKNRNVVDN